MPLLGSVLAMVILVAGCGGTETLTTGSEAGTTQTGTTFTDTSVTDTTFTATTATTGLPTTYDDAVALIDAGRSSGITDQKFETTGSGIFCIVEDRPGTTACETHEKRFPPPAGDCAFPDGPKEVGRVEFDDDAIPTPICNSDTIRSEDPPQTEAGDVVSSASTNRRCLTTEDGAVVCIDRTAGTGFTLDNDDGYRLMVH